MTFAFPTIKAPRKMKGRLLSASQEPENNGGGVDQRFLSPGSRYEFACTYPPMEYEDARIIVAALLRSEREEVVMDLLQPGLNIGAPGARAIGAFVSSNATIVPVAGGAVYTVRAFQFFNVTGPDGRLYLHAAVQTNNVPGNLRVAPALRTDFAGGAAVDFTAPKVQGFIAKGSTEWDVDEAHHYGVSFTIKETGE